MIKTILFTGFSCLAVLGLAAVHFVGQDHQNQQISKESQLNEEIDGSLLFLEIEPRLEMQMLLKSGDVNLDKDKMQKSKNKQSETKSENQKNSILKSGPGLVSVF